MGPEVLGGQVDDHIVPGLHKYFLLDAFAGPALLGERVVPDLGRYFSGGITQPDSNLPGCFGISVS